MNRYPTLDIIDRLRPNKPSLTNSPNAAMLERTGRRLIAEYWSEYALLTGQVGPASLAAVTDRLDRMA